MSLVVGTREVGRSKISKCCDSRPVVFFCSFDWISTTSEPSIFTSYSYRSKPILISAVEENTLIPACVIGIGLIPICRILFVERISKVITGVIQSVTVDVIDLLPLRKNLLMHEYAFALSPSSAHSLGINNTCTFGADEWTPSKLVNYIVIFGANASDISPCERNEADRWITRLSKYWSGMWLKRHNFITPKIRLYHTLEAV